MIVDTPFKSIFKPRIKQRAVIKIEDGQIMSLQIFDKEVMGTSDKPAVEAHLPSKKPDQDSVKTIFVNMYEKKGNQFIPLTLIFKYMPSQGYAPVHEVMEGRNLRIKGFFFFLKKKKR